MALTNTEDPYIFILAEEVRKNARAEIASLQYSRNRLLNSNDPKDIMAIDTYNFRIAALKQFEKDAKTIVKDKKGIEKETDDPKERQILLEDYAENVNLGTIRKLKFANEIISSEKITKLNVDYFNSPTNNTGTNASNKHETFDFDFNNTYHETYPTVNSFDNNSDISADDNESFVDSVIDNQVDDDNLLDSVDDNQVDVENLFDSVENFRDDENISLYNYVVNNQDEGDNLHDSVDDIQVAGENLVEYNLGESSFDAYTDDNASFVEDYQDDNASLIANYPDDNASLIEDYPDDNASLIEDYPDDNASLFENYPYDNESSFNDVLDTVQQYYDRTSITPDKKNDPDWNELLADKAKQNSKIKPHINDITSLYHNLIKKEEQHKKKNNYFTDRNKKTASEKFNTYYKTLINRDRVDEKYLNSQINAAYSVIGHDYYQPKKNSKWSSLLSGTKQKSNESKTKKNTSYTISSERLSNLKPAKKLIRENNTYPTINTPRNSQDAADKPKVVVNPNNTGANQGITIPERTTSRNHGMTPRINRH